jgi:bacteriocin-like protein
MTNMNLEVLNDAELDQVTGGDTTVQNFSNSGNLGVGVQNTGAGTNQLNQSFSAGVQVGFGIAGDVSITF